MLQGSSRFIVPAITALFLSLLGASEASADQEGKQATSQATSGGVVNVNTATATQLALLPGVGPSRAQAIITARERRPFRTVNELMRVRGIGRATLQQLRPLVTVSGETTLRRAVPARRSEQ
jgi:competence protein ComEA